MCAEYTQEYLRCWWIGLLRLAAFLGGVVFRRNSNIFLEILETVLLAALIFFGTRLIVQNFRIEGPSMSPNLVDAQFLLVNKLSYVASEPERGDVIVFRSPRSPDEDLVKRVVALPNEEVEIKEGSVFVNGRRLNESSYFQNSVDRDTALLRVPDGAYFVLGDNRLHSRDSRDIGPIPRASIVGRVWLVYWPPSDFGVVPTYRSFFEPEPVRAA